MLMTILLSCLMFISTTAAPNPDVKVNIKINIDTGSANNGSAHMEEYTTTPLKPVMCSIKSPTNASQRIVNGVTVGSVELKYPWQVGLKKGYIDAPFEDDFFYCGGTIITAKYILTAAHCFYIDFKKPEFPGEIFCKEDLDLEIIYVGIGSNDFRQTDNEYSMLRKVWPTEDPQKYSCRTRDNDIAIIELNKEIDFDKVGVRPICFTKESPDTFAEATATITGWGSTLGFPPGQTTPDTNYPNILHEAQVTVLNGDNDICTNEKDFTANMICAATQPQDQTVPLKSTCIGDSGGPFTVQHNCEDVLIGITSWSRGCAAEGYPNFYTKVNNYLKSDWFIEFIESEEDGDGYPESLCYR